MRKRNIQRLRRLLTQHSEEEQLTLLDIGASGGLQDRWTPFRKEMRVIGVEPDPNAIQALEQDDEGPDVLLSAAMGARREEKTLHITKKRECSSLFKPNIDFLKRFHEHHRFDVENSITLQLKTLDTEFSEKGLGNVDFIKVDVQGSEKDILEGGRNLLAMTLGVEIEIEFQPLYLGQPLFGEVDTAMRLSGFQLFDISRHFWRRQGCRRGSYRGQLIWGDALYLKDADLLASELDRVDAPKRRCGIVAKAVVISLIYGYPDYAKELISANERHISSDIQEELSGEIDVVSRGRISAIEFRGKTRLANLFHDIGSWLSCSALNSDDRKLGN